MDAKELAGNYYFLAAVALTAVLATGFLVQGGVPRMGGVQSQAAAPMYDAAPDRLAESDGGAGQEEFESAERKRITTVRMDIDVPDVDTAQEDIEGLVSGYEGYVLSSSLDREFGARGRMQVRVPEDDLSTFMNDIEERWTVDSRNRDVHDVTQRHTELTLELENRRQELRQLENLINRTDDVENLIKIQERMGDLRTRIQFLENQLSQLEERVDYATVTITMEEDSAFESRFELRQALTEAYRAVFRSVKLMIVGTGYLLPFAVLIALVYLGRRRLV